MCVREEHVCVYMRVEYTNLSARWAQQTTQMHFTLASTFHIVELYQRIYERVINVCSIW